jgi:two-component system, LytTR family, response regulator
VHDARRPQTLVVRNGEWFDFVPVDSIDRIETANNYTCLHAGSNRHLYGESLTDLEQLLDPGKFLRVHRCCMVNVTRLVAVHAIAGSVFELESRSGARIRSGRQYGEGVRSMLKGGRE